MKKFMTAALVAAGVLTSSNCLAALEYNYDADTKVFAVKSQDVIALEDGANQLTLTFSKEYDLSKKKVKPVMRVSMAVEGTKEYQLADNANYWQEHNYTYEEMGLLQADKAKQEAEEKARQKAKAEGKKYEKPEEPEMTEAEQEEKEKLAQELEDLKERKLGRNASTLIYLQVENSSSRENTAKPGYDFKLPMEEAEADSKDPKETIAAEYDVPDAALDATLTKEGINPSEDNLMELELKKTEAERQRLEEIAEVEALAKMEPGSPEAEALREKIAARNLAKKQAEMDEREKRINERAAENAKIVEQVKATRDAFLKFEAEQKAANAGIVFTTKGTATMSLGDNLWKKVEDSAAKRVPLFFEVKFWTGGANQRLWLQTEKLAELKQLMAYDLATDTEHKALLK